MKNVVKNLGPTSILGHHGSHFPYLLCLQNAELRCLLPRSLLENGFFGSCSGENKENKNNTSPFSSYSWSGQRKVPSYIEKIVFSQEFISTLRTIALQEHELEHTASLLGEVSVFHTLYHVFKGISCICDIALPCPFFFSFFLWDILVPQILHDIVRNHLICWEVVNIFFIKGTNAWAGSFASAFLKLLSKCTEQTIELSY